MRQARSLLAFSAIVVILLSGAAIEAAEPMLRSEVSRTASPAEVAADAKPGDTQVKVFGVQVFIDPETGLMRTPSPEEAAALAAEMQRQFGARSKAAAEPRQTTLADGAVMAELDPSLYSVAVARVLPDGTVSFDCVKGHDHGLEDGRHAHSGAETE
jgi:hypothetical protein